jgi:2-(3-amino-3-carboxypropyl)histidine synthase
MYDLDPDRIAAWVRDGGYRTVALQLPEGLKTSALGLADAISDATGAEVLILGHPCYGACDLFIDYRRHADALVHLGHAPIPDMGSDPDVLHVEVGVRAGLPDGLPALLEGLPQRIGLLATVQHIALLPALKEAVEATGRTALIGKGDGRLHHPGQVLGCNCSAATAVEDDADMFILLAEGDFHPLAASIGSGRPVRILNPLTGELRDVDEARDRLLRRRFAAIESARPARDFLVIVCGKAGQDRTPEARAICGRLRRDGRTARMLLLDEISPEALLPYRVDAYVCTGCPRVAMDDASRYARPMLTVTEVDHVLGLRSWEEYRFDCI